MSTAPSVPGVEASGPLARQLRACADRRAGPGCWPNSWPGRSTRRGRWRLAPGLADHWVKITGPADRKVVINAVKCGAKLFMADFEDEPMPVARIAQVPFGPLALFAKEYVHARRLPAGL